MLEKFREELEKFEHFFMAADLPWQSESVCQYGYRILPSHSEPTAVRGKKNGLTLMALTHGNELGGIAVLNDVLNWLKEDSSRLKYPMQIILGNPWASLENKRFKERDLNRSFDRPSAETHEERRANELEPLLAETAWLLDIHQTIEPAERPFMIFPYTEGGVHFARQVAPRLPIVTHWGDSFSAEGKCSDEYVNSAGGVGITIELGQNGIQPYQVAVGVQACLNAMDAVSLYHKNKSVEPRLEEAEIFTWGQVVPWPENDSVLDEGWYNFKEVKKGEKLGGSNSDPIIAELDGAVLFPKYLRKSTTRKPTEICRIMKKVQASELGQ
ncbi:MAG: hypothetical protein CMP10_02010 [Zetaproteobacteria bacterium]|nr:hypothetical protein [Pseudobdellovibrionaceae bacterium]|tara:strand:+ start:809 stop:1789 length:981 start_codon:yes stop_codon:yes gene_type:complete